MTTSDRLVETAVVEARRSILEWEDVPRQLVVLSYICHGSIEDVHQMIEDEYADQADIDSALLAGNFTSIDEAREHCRNVDTSPENGKFSAAEFVIEMLDFSSRFPYFYEFEPESYLCMLMTDRVLKVETKPVDLRVAGEIDRLAARHYPDCASGFGSPEL